MWSCSVTHHKFSRFRHFRCALCYRSATIADENYFKVSDHGDKGNLVDKIEFSVAGVIAALTLVIGGSDDGVTSENFFLDPVTHYTLTFYGSFLFINFYILPRLLRKESIVRDLVFTAITFGVISLVCENVNIALVSFGIFAAYCIFKYLMRSLWSRAETIRSRYTFVTPGTLLAVVLWLLSMSFILMGEVERFVTGLAATMIPFGMFLYSYSFYSLIPKALTRKHPFRAYLLYFFLALVASAFPMILLSHLVVRDRELSLAITLVNFFFQAIITIPFSWVMFKRQMNRNEELSSLKKELGQSEANIDFLRSQINPHFLFNALNTLYGTALQENAERTSEGIQRLGDMMRFMLQENMQEKISLAREIEYLHHYIALQKLRTAGIPSIQIEVAIEPPARSYRIAPMLLILFVENAFKHGISFREPSQIRIRLESKDDMLFFRVDNSRHPKSENDPEKDKSGIGLGNVKQRLLLLYPGKHELIIRETVREFFIHLTIPLS